MSAPRKTAKRARRSPKTVRLDLDGQLARLENAELVRRLAETEPAYLFKHTLTQETAYESLLLKKRREIHLQVAKLYERFYPDRLDEFAALLAHHYGEAGEDAKTLEYETRSGDVSARRYANAESFAAYSRALQIAIRVSPGDRPRIQDLYLKRGRVLELSGKYAEALTNYDEMETTARGQGDQVLELASLLARATLLATPTPVHNPTRAREILEQALALARELGDPAAEAKGLWNMMLLSKFTSHPQKAASYGEQALAIARKHNLREQMAFVLNDLAIHAYLDIGALGDTLRSLDEAKQLWRELDNQPMLGDSLVNIAQTHAVLGDFDEAIRASLEARAIGERIGNLWGQSYSRFVEGDIYIERGEVERAIRVMEECIELGDQAGFVVPSIWIRSNLAFVYGTMGNVERGVELARMAQQSAETRLASWRAAPLAVLARLELFRGRVREAEQELEEAHLGQKADYLTKIIFRMAIPIGLARAELELARGDYGTAEVEIDLLLARVDESGARSFRPEVLFLKSQAAIAVGRQDEAREVLVQARSEAEALGSRRMLWRILAELVKMEDRGGNKAAAEEFRTCARENVEFIAEHAPADLRRLFLELPDVRQVLGDEKVT